MTLTGKIESFEYRNSGGKEMKVVTICPDNRQRAFVQFRDHMMTKLGDYKENDMISVIVELKGSISKNSGIQFNNLVAVEVVPIF